MAEQLGFQAAKAFFGPNRNWWDEIDNRLKALEIRQPTETGNNGGGNLLTIVKESFSGSSSIIKAFSEDMHGFVIANDGTGDITFVINEDAFVVKAGEVFEENFDAFNIVNITSNGVPFRAYSKALMDGMGNDATAPEPITNLTIGRVEPNFIEVLWTASTSGDVMNYEVSYSLDGTRFSIASNSINAAYTSYTIPNLTPSTDYIIRLVAIDTSYNRSSERLTTGTTAPPDMIAPEEVGQISTSNLTEKSLTLKWVASPSNDVVAYEIYQAGVFIGESSSLSYGVTGLTSSTSYTFTVKAKDGSGNISNGVSYSVITSADIFPPTISISPAPGTYTTAKSVVLSSDESATIYYTLDGTTPTELSTVYSAPISISSNVTVKYFGKDVAGNPSAIQSAVYYIDITPPEEVTALTMTNVGERSVTLSWTASTSNDLSRYEVYQGTTKLSDVFTTSYNVSNLVPNNPYTFKVVCVDSTGNKSTGVTVSGSTLADTTPPNDVTGLTASNVTGTSLTLNWTASPSSDLDSYDVYRDLTLLANTTNTTLNVTNLALTTQYTFKVVAKDTVGNASVGSSVTVTTPADTTPPNNVTNLVASNYTASSVMLSWTASTSGDVASYDIYNGASLHGNTATTSYNVTGLSPGSYTLWVKAKDAVGNVASGASIPVTITIPDTTAPSVTASPAAGTYTTAQTVTLSSNETATIYYTTDGTEPTTSSAVYAAPISITTTKTLKFFGKDAAGNSSAVQTLTYTIDASAPVVYVDNGYLNMPVTQMTWSGLTGQETAQFLGMCSTVKVPTLFEQSYAESTFDINGLPYGAFGTGFTSVVVEARSIPTSGSPLGKPFIWLSKTRGITVAEMNTFIKSSGWRMKYQLKPGYKTVNITSNISTVTTRTSGVDTTQFEYFKCVLNDGVGTYAPPPSSTDLHFCSNGYQVLAAGDYVFSRSFINIRVNADSTLEMLLPKGTLTSIDQAGVSAYLASANLKIYGI